MNSRQCALNHIRTMSGVSLPHMQHIKARDYLCQTLSDLQESEEAHVQSVTDEEE